MKMIQEWLGHSDISTTVDIRYPHKKQTMSKWSELYRILVEKIPLFRQTPNEPLTNGKTCCIIISLEHIYVL